MSSLMRRILAVGSSVFLLSSALPAFAQVGECGDFDALTDTNKTRAINVVSRLDPSVPASGPERIDAVRSNFSSYFCQNVGEASESKREQACVSGLCDGPPSVMCCAQGTGGREGTAGAEGDGSETGTDTGGGFLQLQLPACTKAGNCGLDDIVRTGVNFANLLFGLSGAVLLATFVYGGVLYLTAGSSANVSKAKDMLKNALIGMVLVFGAGLLVSTIYRAFLPEPAGAASNREQRAESEEQRAESKEQRAESKEQRTKSKEQL